MGLIEEIRRRTLWQVLGLYAAGAWVVLQVVDVLANSFDLPSRYPAIAVVILIVGFPLVLATAFVQQRRLKSRDAEEGGIPSVSPESETGSRATARRLLTWRNLIGGGVAAAALWGVLVTAWMITRDGQNPDASGGVQSEAISRTVVAVLPFSVRGGQNVEYLGDGMVSLLGTKLDGAGELRSVDARALLSYVEREGQGTLDPSRGAQIAARFGAGLFVMGDIVEAGGRLRVSSYLYETADSAPVAEALAEGEDAFALVDEVAAGLLAGVEGGPGARVRQIAAVTTTSLPALRAYLEGEAEFRSGRFEAALNAFRRAVEEDTLYALAYYRLSEAAEWLTRPEIATAAAENAYRHAGRLSERDRRLLEAAIAWRRGSFSEAERRYRSLVGTYPSDVEAWFQLGEVLFHSTPLRGRSFAESREPFERVLSFEPDHAASIIHLARLAAREGRRDDLSALVDRFRALNPEGDRLYPMVGLDVFAGKRVAAADSFLTALDPAPDLSVVQSAWELLTYARDLDGGRRVTRLLVRPDRSPDVRTIGRAYLAYMHAAQGRWRDAGRELDSIAVYDPVSAIEYRTLLSLVPLAPVSEAELRSLLSGLETTDPGDALESGNPSMFFNVHDRIHGVIRLYLEGVLSARLGRPEAALAHAARLETSEAPGPDLAASVRAQLALHAGLSEDALAAMEGVRQEYLYNVTLVSPVYNMTLERFTRAELLRALGREEEALGWYENIGDATSFELPYISISQLRSGEVLEELGRPAEAAARYARFADLWRDADPELRPLVEKAREAALRLKSDLGAP